MDKIQNNIAKIQSLQSSGARYKLVVCQVEEGELADYADAWDVGYSLSEYIRQNIDSDDIAMEFASECTSQAQKHTTMISEIGRCLVMKNYGILHEAALQFNIQNFVKRCAQNNVLVLLTTGLVEDGRVYLTNAKSDYFINISDINYIMI